jgi:hypothetical protein
MRGILLRDRTQYYVALQTQPGAKAVVVGDPSPNFSIPVKTVIVNGMIYAFDRTTGELNWATIEPIEAQSLLLDYFEESPVLLMTALQARQQPGAPSGNQVQFVAIRSIDKQTGKAVYRKEFMNNNNPDPFYSIEMNVRTGTIDLVNSTSQLRHTLEAAKGTGEPKGG